MQTYTFSITGLVQGVFFRKTIVTLAHKYGLTCGATNSSDPSMVIVSFCGDYEKIKSLLTSITTGKAINNCGCTPRSYKPYDKAIELNAHQMNSDKIKQSPIPDGIDFFI